APSLAGTRRDLKLKGAHREGAGAAVIPRIAPGSVTFMSTPSSAASSELAGGRRGRVVEHVVRVSRPDSHFLVFGVLDDAKLVLRGEDRDAHRRVAGVPCLVGAFGGRPGSTQLHRDRGLAHPWACGSSPGPGRSPRPAAGRRRSCRALTLQSWIRR